MKWYLRFLLIISILFFGGYDSLYACTKNEVSFANFVNPDLPAVNGKKTVKSQSIVTSGFNVKIDYVNSNLLDAADDDIADDELKTNRKNSLLTTAAKSVLYPASRLLHRYIIKQGAFYCKHFAYCSTKRNILFRSIRI